MGYQESYFTAVKKLRGNARTSNNERFEQLIQTIRNNGYDAYDNMWCKPVEVITLGEDVMDYRGYIWKKGTKFIYFVGERFPQSYGNGRRGNMLLHPECNGCDHFRGQKVADGECGPWSCRNEQCEHHLVEDLDLIFTEEMSPESIWSDSGNNVTAIHEPFWLD